MDNSLHAALKDLFSYVLDPLSVKATASLDMIASLRSRLALEAASQPNRTSALLLDVLDRLA
jgi:hypothetical protein